MPGANPMAGVLRALTRFPRRGRGRVLLLIGARREDGVSTAARAVAEAAGPATTLLLDLDVLRNTQHRSFTDGSLRGGFSLSAGIDGRLKGVSLYRIVAPDGRPRKEARAALSYYRVGRSKIFVSGFDPRAVAEGDRIQIPPTATYWDAARQSCDLCVVDAPALERSRVGLTIAPFVDAVCLVVSARDHAAAGAIALRAELGALNAPIAGLIYTHADPVSLSVARMVPG